MVIDRGAFLSGRYGEVFEEILKIKERETTKDGLFTLETVACLGCCSLAPVMMVGATVYGRLTTKDIRRILREYQHPTSAAVKT